MDNERIEEMLRTCAAPPPPEGMRERILTRSLAEQQRPVWTRVTLRWHSALALAAVLVAFWGGAVDGARQARLSEMLHVNGGVTAPPAAGSLFRNQDGTKRLVLVMLLRSETETQGGIWK